MEETKKVDQVVETRGIQRARLYPLGNGRWDVIRDNCIIGVVHWEDDGDHYIGVNTRARVFVVSRTVGGAARKLLRAVNARGNMRG